MLHSVHAYNIYPSTMMLALYVYAQKNSHSPASVSRGLTVDLIYYIYMYTYIYYYSSYISLRASYIDSMGAEHVSARDPLI